MYLQTTIAAIATAPGEGGIGIVRISGAAAKNIGNRIFRMKNGNSLDEVPPFSMHFGHVMDGPRIIDEGLCVYMKAPHSYTGEDVVEIQIHGSTEALKETLRLAETAGAVPAQRGEFTERAFLNRRIDLAQADAVMDIIQARSAAALSLAETHLAGALSGYVKNCRGKLKDMITKLEVTLDFPEEDLEDMTLGEIEIDLIPIEDSMQALLSRAEEGRIIREGMRTIIVGRPNVGKSSLLNALLQEERAIVTDIPGTTRDTIEETIMVGGVPLVLIDTAGLRQTDDEVEHIGVERTKKSMASADLILAVINGSEVLTEADRELLKEINDRRAVIILNQSDRPQKTTDEDIRTFGKWPVVSLSARYRQGMEKLEEVLRKFTAGQDAEASRELYLMNERHVNLVGKALRAVRRAHDACGAGLSADCISVDLTEAWEDLGRITGDTVDDELISSIFSRFCVGK